MRCVSCTKDFPGETNSISPVKCPFCGDRQVSIERKVKDLILLSQALSTSGKYEIFYGEHMNKGSQCYDVGGLNCMTGMITRRHYTDKAAALACWEEFYQLMTSADSIPDENEGERYVTIN